MVWIFRARQSPNYVIDEVRSSARSFERIAAFDRMSGVLLGQGEPLEVLAVVVDSNFFPVLAPRPLLGALPSATDVQSGAPILIIGERLWRTRFNAAPDIIRSSRDDSWARPPNCRRFEERLHHPRWI
jgi:hypothetical protein